MKKINLYQIDAFTSRLFSGNPACVVPLKEWLDDSILLKIAKENAVPETAFFVETALHLRTKTGNTNFGKSNNDANALISIRTKNPLLNFIIEFLNWLSSNDF